MRKLIILLFLINQSTSAQQIKLESDTISIGEQVRIYIECKKNQSEKIDWPVFKDTLVSGVEIINISNIDTNIVDDNSMLLSQELIITCWDSGTYNIKPILLNDSKITNELVLKVNSVLINLEKAEKDIKEPMKVPFHLNEILPYLLLLILLLIIIYLIRKILFKRVKKNKPTKKKEKIACHIIALKALEELNIEELWQKGELKSYHARISEIIRTYIEERYGFIAMELPTGEILDALIKENLKKNIIIDLSTILERADLAKFAKSKPGETENKESMSLSLSFIEHTKLIIQND